MRKLNKQRGVLREQAPSAATFRFPFNSCASKEVFNPPTLYFNIFIPLNAILLRRTLGGAPPPGSLVFYNNSRTFVITVVRRFSIRAPPAPAHPAMNYREYLKYFSRQWP